MLRKLQLNIKDCLIIFKEYEKYLLKHLCILGSQVSSSLFYKEGNKSSEMKSVCKSHVNAMITI